MTVIINSQEIQSLKVIVSHLNTSTSLYENCSIVVIVLEFFDLEQFCM